MWRDAHVERSGQRVRVEPAQRRVDGNRNRRRRLCGRGRGKGKRKEHSEHAHRGRQIASGMLSATSQSLAAPSQETDCDATLSPADATTVETAESHQAVITEDDARRRLVSPPRLDGQDRRVQIYPCVDLNLLRV